MSILFRPVSHACQKNPSLQASSHLQNLRVYIILVSLKSPLSVLFLPVATWLLECGTVLGTTLAARKVVFQPRHDGDADAIDGDQRLHVLLGHATRWGSHTVIFRVFKPTRFRRSSITYRRILDILGMNWISGVIEEYPPIKASSFKQLAHICSLQCTQWCSNVLHKFYTTAKYLKAATKNSPFAIRISNTYGYLY